MGLFDKFSRKSKTDTPTQPSLFAKGLAKTRSILTADLKDLLRGRLTLDDTVLEELETRLLIADVGLESTQLILDRLRKKASATGSIEQFLETLAEIMIGLLQAAPQQQDKNFEHKPHSLLIVGVNGSGKTTTIGKLAHRYRQAGHSVMLAAGDTFRAAAIEQLNTWAERNHVPIIAQGSGSDPAAVIFDGLQAARSRQMDVLIADTAGRLHTQSGLMDELKKIKRVMQKVDPLAPHETLLVLDAGIGQNALQQARQFNEAIGVTGLILTKMDGTAKGGIVFAIQQQLQLPVQYIGVGEGMDDLQPFDPTTFVEALLTQS